MKRKLILPMLCMAGVLAFNARAQETESVMPGPFTVANGPSLETWSPTTNLIQNGSFEYADPYQYWTYNFSAAITSANYTVKTDADSGEKYLVGTTNAGSSQNGSLSMAWELEEGATYVFSYRMKTEKSGSTNTQYLKTSLTNTKGTETLALGTPTAAAYGEWTTFTRVFTNTSNYKYLQIVFRWLNGQWGFDNFVLAKCEKTAETGNLQYLQDAIPTANIGDDAFQYAQSAIDAAQQLIAADEATVDEVAAAYAALVKHNAPDYTSFILKLQTDDAGNALNNKVVTYIAGGRNDGGGYAIGYYADANPNYAQGFVLEPVQDEANTYILGQRDLEGAARYLCTGRVYGGNDAQIRTTLDEAQAMKVRIDVSPTEEGIVRLYNVAAGAYIGSQDVGFFTVNKNNRFQIAECEYTSIPVSNHFRNVGEWYTWTIPAPLPTFICPTLTFYKATGIDGTVVTLEPITGELIPGCTPLAVYVGGTNLPATVRGPGASPAKDEFTGGVMTGTLAPRTVTAADNAWLLQDGANGLGFYKVRDESEITVPAYRAWVTHDESAVAQGGSVKGLTFVVKDGESTAISTPDATAPAAVRDIHGLSGARQDGLRKGINIVRMTDGTVRKVMVK